MSSASRRDPLRRACASTLFGIEPLEDRRLLSGSISGTVTAPTGYNPNPSSEVLAGASITLYQNLSFVAAATSDAHGHFSFTGVPAGDYFVGLGPQADEYILSPSNGGYDVKLATDQNLTGEDFVTETAAGVSQRDGRMLVARSESPFAPATLSRFSSNRTLDTTFGSNGVITLAPRTFSFPFHTVVSTVIVQPDQSILVLTNLWGDGTNADLHLFDSTGTLVREAGIAQGEFGVGLFINSVLLQPDGKIIGIGAMGIKGGTDQQLAITRYNADFSLDTAFGTGGIVTIDTGRTRDDDSSVTPSLLPGRPLAVKILNYDVTINAAGNLESLVRLRHARTATAVSLTVSPPISGVGGHSVTLTARVRVPYDARSHASVQFCNGDTVLGLADISPTGHATLVVSNLTAGRYRFTVNFLPTHRYLGSRSQVVKLIVT